MPTRERQAATKLAAFLRANDLPEMAGKAETLYYSDFSSPLALPKMTLVDDLTANGREDLVEHVVRGEFDG